MNKEFPKEITVGETTYEVRRWTKHGKDRLYLKSTRRFSKTQMCYDLINNCWVKVKYEANRGQNEALRQLGIMGD